jgi:hypothetical protein
MTIQKKTGMLSVLLLNFIFLRQIAAQNLPRPDPEKQDWRILQNARNCFENKEYGDALYLAKQAEVTRKEYVDWTVYTLNTALNPAEVRKEGDSLSAVLPVLERRQTTDAVMIIQRMTEKKAPGFFHDSIQKLMDYLKKSYVYPEAEFLKGEIYQLEGEYALAMQFYDAAWQNSFYLDIPDQKYDILYQMADLAFNRNKMDDYEKYLLLIVADDPFYRNAALCTAMTRTILSKNAKDKNSFENFFLLYRATDTRCISSYFKLADYYNENSLHNKALTASALGVLTVFSRIYDIIKVKDVDFVYSDFRTFLAEIKKYPDILDWCDENSFWQGLFSFAGICETNGATAFSTETLSILAAAAPEEYWRKKALVKLSSSF